MLAPVSGQAGLKTWDGRHSIDAIEVTIVYFLPRDREPLPDWKERVDYFARRIEQFHQREFEGQSKLRSIVRPEPFRSARTTSQLRDGDGDFIFFQTLREVDSTLDFGAGERNAFPILLVLSDINWRPLDDFYRAVPEEKGWKFEGNLSGGRHFPGSSLGGARATYLSGRGVGWGLVSADGWRVPYSGSDCVVYHEGLGHTVGLPHPEPGNGSVMSQGQYRGWLSESWLDDDQKARLGWTPAETKLDRSRDLYSTFTAIPVPVVPRPQEPVSLKLTWPPETHLNRLRVRIQTDLAGPWVEVAQLQDTPAPESIAVGTLDRPTPVAYRIDAETRDQKTVELWGYFQVRSQPDRLPQPRQEITSAGAPPRPRPTSAIDLLARIDVTQDRVAGEWQREERTVTSPKAYGARIEIPYEPPAEYELTVIVEPLDAPNGLILGQRSGGRRFLTLLNYERDRRARSALENVDGKNVDENHTTVIGPVLEQGQLSQIVCTVRKGSVRVLCDGHEVLNWSGRPEQLSLSDYWKTPHDNVLFLGAYDCRYRFHRVTLSPLQGEGKETRPATP